MGPQPPQRWRFAAAWRSATRSSMTSACRSSQASPGSWCIRATRSPVASRWLMTMMTWRLAAAFCSSAQVEYIQAGAHLRPGDHCIRPLPWPRAARQSAHISTVNRPPTLSNGPAVDPQKKQPSAIVSRCSNWCSPGCYGSTCQPSAGCQQRSHMRPRVAP